MVKDIPFRNLFDLLNKRLAPNGDPGKIAGDTQLPSFCLPPFQLTADFFKNIEVQFCDGAFRFQQFDITARIKQPLSRMIPAGNRFRCPDRPIFSAHNELQKHLKFPIPDSTQGLLFQSQPLAFLLQVLRLYQNKRQIFDDSLLISLTGIK